MLEETNRRVFRLENVGLILSYVLHVDEWIAAGIRIHKQRVK